jgi:hypothetical protein
MKAARTESVIEPRTVIGWRHVEIDRNLDRVAGAGRENWGSAPQRSHHGRRARRLHKAHPVPGTVS